MKKLLRLLAIASFAIIVFGCSGGSSESNNEAQVEEMKSIEKDAQKTMDEIENETEELEQDVDSLLREI